MTRLLASSLPLAALRRGSVLGVGLALLFLASGPAEGQVPRSTQLVGLGGKCLDVLGGSHADQGRVVLFDCHGGSNQAWSVPERETSGPIVGPGGRCLDVAGGSTGDGATVQVFSCHGGDNQQWTLDRAGRLVGLGGKCLDVLGADDDDRTPVVLWTCHGGPNQLWRPRTPDRWTSLWPTPSEAPVGWFHSLAIDADDRDHVVASAGAEVVLTTDGGTTWNVEPGPAEFGIETLQIHPSDASRILVGGVRAGAPVFAESFDAGATWRVSAVTSTALGPVVDLDASPRPGDPLVVAVEGWEAGIFVSDDQGETWRRTLAATFLDSLLRDPLHPLRLWTSGSSGTYRSTDGGKSWESIHWQRFSRLAADPSRLGRLYGIFGAFAQVSEDAGATWTRLVVPATMRGSHVALDVSAEDGRVAVGSSFGQVFLSDDGGATWTELTAGGASVGLGVLRFDPTDPTRLWAGRRGLVQVGDWGAVDGRPVLLLGDRFEVTVEYRDFEGSDGVGRPVVLTEDTGAFWFFDPGNVEIVVKVVDATEVNGRHWVFAGALSNVEFTLTVSDLQTGETRTYFNPSGTFASFGDIEAF